LPLPVGAMPPPVGVGPLGPPPLASFLGFMSRILMFFLVLFDISVLLFWVVYRFCCLDYVSDAEQQLASAGNVLFWDQIVEAEQSFFFAFGAGIF
jgi:hypothetical protein